MKMMKKCLLSILFLALCLEFVFAQTQPGFFVKDWNPKTLSNPSGIQKVQTSKTANVVVNTFAI